MRDPNAPISTLAKDGKFGGVAFLVPLDEQLARHRPMPVRRDDPQELPLLDARGMILR